MEKSKLSILIPSNRPDALKRFIESLRITSSDFNSIELVILEDSTGSERLVIHEGNQIRIKYPKTEYTSDRMHECYKNSTANWIMFGNDDLIMETRGWDMILDSAFQIYKDQIVMFYPDDTIFGVEFPCFPIVSRKVLEESNFFPLPNFIRYKVDDCIIQIMPDKRIIYIPHIVLRHLNIVDEIENPMPNKWGYKVDEKIGEQDHETFVKAVPRLQEMKLKLESLILK